MWIESAGAVACAMAGWMTWAVRGRSSSVFGPSVWRGRADRPAIALTFDDGPSESTPELLDTLDRHGARATFFQCGENVRRLPEIAREVARRGHEIGNHSDTHAAFCKQSGASIYDELARTQAAIFETSGVRPSVFRAPYGVRWFGLRAAQRKLGLLGVMWTEIGNDWKLPAGAIAARLSPAASNGAIFCLHDGRDVQARPDIRATLEAVRRLIPELERRGYRFETVSEIL